ncbi:glycosyltransferase family 4 protein [Gordonia terrae]
MTAEAAAIRGRRIVVLTDRMTPGGVSHFILQIATHFARQGHRVDVVSLAPGEWDHRLTESGIRRHLLMSPSALRRLRSADVIHCQQRFLGFVSTLLGRRSRTVEHVHNVLTDHPTASYRTPRIVAVSAAIRESLLAHYPHLSPHRVSVVHNGVHKLRTAPPAYEDRSYDFVNVARFDEQKDPLLFLELAKELSRRHTALRCLWIAPGSGPLRDRFLHRRRELGLERIVDLSIGDTHAHTRAQVAQSRVFLLTSQWEGLPLSALEALASGTPVATTPCGEITRIVSQRSCGLVIDTEAADRAGPLLDVVEDRSRWERLSQRAFEVADDFSETRMTTQVERIYAGIDPAFIEAPRDLDNQPTGRR